VDGRLPHFTCLYPNCRVVAGSALGTAVPLADMRRSAVPEQVRNLTEWINKNLKVSLMFKVRYDPCNDHSCICADKRGT
jgi:hypothetical protein